MEAGIYLNFKNTSKEVIAFYEEVFNSKCVGLMTYGQMPADPDFAPRDDIKDLVLNASMNIHGMDVMFSDVPDGMGLTLTMGDNISIVVNTKDEAVLTKEFNALAEGGKIVMPLEKTFWSEKYGNVVDKYGIGWQFNLAE